MFYLTCCSPFVQNFSSQNLRNFTQKLSKSYLIGFKNSLQIMDNIELDKIYCTLKNTIDKQDRKLFIIQPNTLLWHKLIRYFIVGGTLCSSTFPSLWIESYLNRRLQPWLVRRVQGMERSDFSFGFLRLFYWLSGVFEWCCFFVDFSSSTGSFCSFHLSTDQTDFCPQ